MQGYWFCQPKSAGGIKFHFPPSLLSSLPFSILSYLLPSFLSFFLSFWQWYMHKRMMSDSMLVAKWCRHSPFNLTGPGSNRPSVEQQNRAALNWQCFLLSQVGKAMQRMHERKNVGKIILSPMKEPEPEPEPTPPPEPAVTKVQYAPHE